MNFHHEACRIPSVGAAVRAHLVVEVVEEVEVVQTHPQEEEEEEVVGEPPEERA